MQTTLGRIGCTHSPLAGIRLHLLKIMVGHFPSLKIPVELELMQCGTDILIVDTKSNYTLVISVLNYSGRSKYPAAGSVSIIALPADSSISTMYNVWNTLAGTYKVPLTRIRFSAGEDCFIFVTTSTSAVCPAWPSAKFVPCTISLGLWRSEPVYNSPASSARIVKLHALPNLFCAAEGCPINSMNSQLFSGLGPHLPFLIHSRTAKL